MLASWVMGKLHAAMLGSLLPVIVVVINDLVLHYEIGKVQLL